MNLTTDYAIRTMLYLAIKGDRTSSREISEKMEIPQKFLLNILSRLRKAALVRNYVGVNGGFMLAQKPEDISLLHIVKVTEGNSKIGRRVEEETARCCYEQVDIPIRDFYGSMRAEIMQMLEETTLASLMPGARESKEPAAGGVSLDE